MNRPRAVQPYRRDVPHGLMFHRFRATHDQIGPQGALTPADLERVLLRVGVDRILSPHEWMQRARHGLLKAQDLCLTFDDGLLSQLQHALPVLESFQLQAFWFVYSCVFDGVPVMSEVYSHAIGQFGGMPAFTGAFLSRCQDETIAQLETAEFARYAETMRVDAPFYSTDDLQFRFLRNQPKNAVWFDAVMHDMLEEHGIEIGALSTKLWLNNADLKALTQAGHCIGLHSYDHPYAMGALPREQQVSQYGRNLEHIESVTGTRPRCASHPLNSYNDVTLEVLRELGVECAFRANMVQVAHQGISADRLEAAREDAANLTQ